MSGGSAQVQLHRQDPAARGARARGGKWLRNKPPCPRTVRLTLRLAGVIAVAVTGLLVARAVGVHGLGQQPAFFLLASMLLAIGLYSATSAIDYRLLAEHWRIVVVAITVGVLLKAGLITAVMWAVFHGEPSYLVLGVAMAQIDPLSVATLRRGSRLSERGRAILTAWSSFDDPVTTLLVILLVGVAVDAGAGHGEGIAITALIDPVTGTVGNVVLVLLGAVGYCVLRWLVPGNPASRRPDDGTVGWQLVAGGLVAAILVVGAVGFWMLGVAVLGLFLRVVSSRYVVWCTNGAFLGAVFALGLVLADGNPRWGPGILLGFATYGAQVVVGLAITWRLRGDRAPMALAQQSGITAVLLALLLEPVIPGTIAVVAPAIVTVAVLYIVANALLELYKSRATRPSGTSTAAATGLR